MAGRPADADYFISELEFLIRCDVGEAAITRVFGKPRTLERRLHRAGRPDLIPRVFQHQAQQTEEQRLSGQYRKYALNK